MMCSLKFIFGQLYPGKVKSLSGVAVMVMLFGVRLRV